jgi:Mg-chelatase subunit ChlD
MLRLKKSLSEKIYLLSANQVSNEEWNFKLRGQSGNTYEQVLSPTTFSCSCPDHKSRATFCKHLLFLVARVAVQMELAAKLQQNKANWKSTAFDACVAAWINRLKNHTSAEKRVVEKVDGDCAICFEEMRDGDELVKCNLTCKNGFHKDCMQQWINSGHNTCPLCRAEWVEVNNEIANGEHEGNIDVSLLQNVAPVAPVATGVSVEPDASIAPGVVVEQPKTDIVFSFDTTGSMSSCIADVRRNIEKVSTKLFDQIPGLRLAIIAHGDYCDGEDTIHILDFTNDKESIKKFIKDAPDTSGGDYPECYELVLHRARELSWRPDATMKSLVMIGDAPPHEKNENAFKLDWKEEVEKLANRNIQVFSVQCLNSGRREAFSFYSTIARVSNGYHLFLNQFSYIVDMIQAICFRQYDAEQLVNFEREIQSREGGMNSALRLMFDTMLGKKSRDEVEAEMHPDRFSERYHKTSRTTHHSSRATGGAASSAAAVPTLEGESDLNPCPPTKFQVFNVENDIGIKEFCDLMSIRFAKGRGFYEFTKPEIIQPQKEIILMNRATGDLYEGDVARRIAGIGANEEKAKIKPGDLPKYRIFIQSTSVNRKLLKNQGFLYEVPAS